MGKCSYLRCFQHVAPIPWFEEFGEGEPVPHGWECVPAALQGHCHGPTSLHIHRNNQTVHRQG